MTDNEIKKALECCNHIEIDCELCPLYTTKECSKVILDSTLDLINRLQARVEKCEKVEHFADKTIATLQAENERLKAEVKFSDYLDYESTNHIKAEAYKEFAEQLDVEIESSDKYIREYDDSEVQKAYNKGLRDALKVLKEMVGEDNA